MTEYDFLLKFDLPDPDANPDVFTDALFEAGCDDATVGLGQNGRIALHFTREAASASKAVTSAIGAVKKAIPGARLVEASPDLVGLTDIADIVHCSRQNVRKIVIGHRSVFPSPLHDGNTVIWNLAKVLKWFKDKGSYKVDDRILELSMVNMRVNIERQIRELDPALKRTIISSFVVQKPVPRAARATPTGAALKIKVAKARSFKPSPTLRPAVAVAKK